MKKAILFLVMAVVGWQACLAGRQVCLAQNEVSEMVKNIRWLGHAAFKIDAGGKVIYIDPFEIQRKDTADIILITHEHYDHCSPDDVDKLQGPNTTIVATKDSAKKLKGNVKIVKPGDRITVEGIEIEAVPAYNVNKQFHPKVKGWVGYIIDVNGVKIYHTGDTDYVPEMNDLKVDVALVAIGGTYTMNAEEAATFVNAVKPRVAIPMHWGSIVGSESDARRFKALCKTQVEILEKSP